MPMKRIIPGCLLLTAALGLTVLGGCRKKVNIVWVNNTDETLDVRLVGVGEGTGFVGRLEGLGDQVRTRVKVEKDMLPMDYEWYAGQYHKTFEITEDTQKDIYFDVGPNIGPRSE
jgi:hypothetical protein